MGLFTRGTTSFLPDGDYLPMAMPTTGIDVLWILTRDGGALRRFGALSDVLVAAEPLPADVVHRDDVVVDAAGTANRAAKAGLSLGIVNTLLKALGGTAEVGLNATGASSVEYRYTDVTADAANLARLDGWLAGADLGGTSARVADLLVAEQLFLVIGALKAGGLTVSLRDERGGKLDLDVPVVQQLVGAGLEVSATSGRTGELTFHGSVALTVAAKVAQLKVDERGFWVNERVLAEGEVRALGEGTDYLDTDEIRLG